MNKIDLTINDKQSLIQLMIDNKTLVFNDKEFSFKNEFLNENILKIENNFYSISDFPKVSHFFLEAYKKKLNYTLQSDFNDNINFLKQIDDDFCSNGYVKDYDTLETELWRIVINESHSKFKCTFTTYIKSLDKEEHSEEIFKFIEVYSKELSNLTLSEDTIYDNTNLLYNFAQSNATYNIPLKSITDGIKSKCNTDYNLGLAILEKSFVNNETNGYLISATVSSLYEISKSSFYDTILKQKIEDQLRVEDIFFGLSQVSKLDNLDCERYIELYNTHKKESVLKQASLSLLFSVIKSKNTNYHKTTLEEVKLAIKDEKSAIFILNNLSSIKNHDSDKLDIVIKIIDQDYFSIEHYIHHISHLFFFLKNIDTFKAVVLAIIRQKPFKPFINHFRNYLNSRQTDKKEIDKFNIELLTANTASTRWIGIKLFETLANRSVHVFSIDILTLPLLTQFKLIIALTHDVNEPKNRLVTLLPLLDSKNTAIKELFLCKLEELSEDYGGHITAILSTCLNSENPNYQQSINRIENYIKSYYTTYIYPKSKIQELNPYHTDYKNIKHFNTLYSRHFNALMNKDAEKNSFLRVFGKTVKLAKGGGWKLANTDEISPLGRIGADFTMPRSYFVDPNKFDMEKGREIKRDWTDEEFININNYLEDEQ